MVVFFSNFILPNNIVIIETIIGVSEMTAVVMTKLWFFDVNSVYRCLLQTVMHLWLIYINIRATRTSEASASPLLS